MEERIIDDEELRKIKIKKTQLGGIEDAVDELAEGDGAEDREQAEEDIVFEIPDEEYDEDLVGLTPSQLQKELARREKEAEEARAECAHLTQEGDRALSEGDYEEAASMYAQALVYDAKNIAAQTGFWKARTRNFHSAECFDEEDVAYEFSTSDGQVKRLVRDKMGEGLNAEYRTLAEEEKQLSPKVEQAMAERREAFVANRNYYLVRFVAWAAALVLMIIGIGVSAYYIVRTTTVVPIVLTGVFGGLALICLAVALVYSRKLVVAGRYLRQNAKLSSTEDGARLAFLRSRMACLDYVLKDEQE